MNIKNNKKSLSLLFFILMIINFNALAMDVDSVVQNLLGPTTIVTQILVYACYIVGAIFCLMAIAQYKVHRDSPKLVPLSTPIMLVFFGLALILLPYLSSLFNSGSVLEYSRKTGVEQEEYKGLALPPLERPRRSGPGDFSQSPSDVNNNTSNRRQRESVSPSDTNVPSQTEPAPEPQHWSEEPQYRR